MKSSSFLYKSILTIPLKLILQDIIIFKNFFLLIVVLSKKWIILLTAKLAEFKNRETVKNLGLNHSLFQVNFVRTYIIDIQNAHQFHTKNIDDLDMYQIFILNNCGDIFPISAILNKN